VRHLNGGGRDYVVEVTRSNEDAHSVLLALFLRHKPRHPCAAIVHVEPSSNRISQVLGTTLQVVAVKLLWGVARDDDYKG
jgi:hypothetical protein